MSGELLVKNLWQQAGLKAYRLYRRFKNLMSTEYGIEIWYWPVKYQLRLLNLNQMAERNGLTFEETAKAVMDVFQVMKKKRKRKDRMPVSVFALTGRKAEGMVTEYVERFYPGGEQWSVRLEELVSDSLGDSVIYNDSAEVFDSLEDFMGGYYQHIQLLREKDNKVRKQYLRKRVYRGSYLWVKRHGKIEEGENEK